MTIQKGAIASVIHQEALRSRRISPIRCLLLSQVLRSKRSVLSLQLENRLSQIAQLVILAPHEVALAVQLSLQMLNCDVQHVLVSLHLD